MTSDMQKTFDNMLEDHGLRKTAFRREVMAIFYQNRGRALTSNELENLLGEFDRITLYRTLKSFENKGLIHQAHNSAGTVKFALCGNECNSDHHQDGHAHFNCHHCGETTCLDHLSDLMIDSVPKGYELQEVQITLNGICNKCTN